MAQVISLDRFYSQKIKTFFTRFDFDKNGSIEVEDFEKWAKKLAKIGNLNSSKSAALLKSILAVWNVYFLPADTNKDGSVEIPELVVHMKNSIKDEKKKESIEATLPIIFDAIDTNKDGKLLFDEFLNYFSSLGITDVKVTKEVFTEMDINADGEISRQEFLDFGIEFFLGTDPNNPARFFFGPFC